MVIFFNIIMILVVAFLVSQRLKKYDSLINHLFFFTGSWTAVIVGSQLSFPEKIMDSTVILYYGCLFSYIFGSSLIKQNMSKDISQRKYSFNNIKLLVLFLLVNCFIANADILDKTIFNFTSIESWVLMRNSKEFDEIDESNIYKAIFQRIYLVYIPLSLFLLKNKKISKVIFVILFASAILLSVLRFTRAPFMFLLIMTLVSYVFIYKVKIPIKYFLVSILVILVVFVVSQFFLLQDKGSASTVVSDVQTYLFGGGLVYQDILQDSYIDNENYDIDLYSFDWLNYILEKLGFIESYPSYVREWSSTHTTNTYTYLDAFTMDFGIVGAVAGSFFIGLFSDFSYWLMKKYNYNLFNIIFYGYICFFNIFVFANNEFIRFAMVLVAVILIILNFLTKKIKYE